MTPEHGHAAKKALPCSTKPHGAYSDLVIPGRQTSFTLSCARYDFNSTKHLQASFCGKSVNQVKLPRHAQRLWQY